MWTQVRQWRLKRVLMRPEAAFPYVFAAEGAQHPPKKPPRSTSPPPRFTSSSKRSSRVEDVSCLDVCMGTGTTQVRQWRQKRVLMRPEAAFP